MSNISKDISEEEMKKRSKERSKLRTGKNFIFTKNHVF